MLDPTKDLAPLIAQLAELARPDLEQPLLYIRATHAYLVKSIAVDQPMLAVPLQGHKRLRAESDWTLVHTGDMALLPTGCRFDTENVPPDAERPYLAVAMLFPVDVLEAARRLLPEPPLAPSRAAAVLAVRDYADELLAWRDAVERGDPLGVRYALVGVVLALSRRGHSALLHPPAPTLAQRIRAMVDAHPARDWTSSQLETDLGVSGATLRRRLADEGASLRDIVADARLAHALNLLITTPLPVKSVAGRVGYASASTFARRFADRYGIEPSRISQP